MAYGERRSYIAGCNDGTRPSGKAAKNVITNHPDCSVLPKEQEATYFIPPDVIIVTVDDGSARLLNMSGGFHAVPAVGARMLKETLANGPSAAATRIAADYGVDRQQVQNDLTKFLGELEKQKLLCRERGRRRRPGVASGLTRLLLQPSLMAVHRLLRSPEAKARTLLTLARLSFALFGWGRTVAAWKDAHARFPARPADAGDTPAIEVLDKTVRAAVASHPISVACKERGLCSWSLARASGLQASIIVGVFLFPIAGHCWCEVGTRIVGDDREWCEEFTPAARW
jgi:hypothetical protein